MRDEEYAGYCCLVIAILCDLNADEARKMYQYGPEHPLCRKILSRKVRMAGLQKLDRKKSGEVMDELLSQGYSVDAVSEAFCCFPSTVRRRVRETREKGKEEEDMHAHCSLYGCGLYLTGCFGSRWYRKPEQKTGRWWMRKRR